MGTDLSGSGFLPLPLLASKRLQLVPGTTEAPSFQELGWWGPGLKGPFSQAWAPQEARSRQWPLSLLCFFWDPLATGGTFPSLSLDATNLPSQKMAAHIRTQ